MFKFVKWFVFGVVAVLSFVFGSFVSADVVFNSKATSDVQTSVNSLAWLHSIDNVSSSVMVVGIAIVDSSFFDRTVTSVSCGLQEFTYLRSDESSLGSVTTEIWYLLEPVVGVCNMSVNFVGLVNGASASSVVYDNVDKVLVFEDDNGGFDLSSNSIITNVSLQSGGVAFDVYISNGFAGVSLFGDSQSLLYQAQLDNIDGGMSQLYATSSVLSSSDLYWYASSTPEWAHSVVSLRPFIDLEPVDNPLDSVQNNLYYGIVLFLFSSTLLLIIFSKP